MLKFIKNILNLANGHLREVIITFISAYIADAKKIIMNSLLLAPLNI